MRSRLGALIASICVVSASPAFAQSDRSPWEIGLNAQVGIPRGEVQVGETSFGGTRLKLHEDLGVDRSEAAELTVAYHRNPSDTLRFSFVTLLLHGTNTLPEDVSFNGAVLAGGTSVRTNPLFNRFTMSYERSLLPLGEGGKLSGSIGLTYVYFKFRMIGTLTANSPGTETKEDFAKQELVIPLVGLRADYPLAERLGLIASLAGGYVPHVNSLRNEGGTIYLTQAHVDANLGLTYALTRDLNVEGGYRYTYFMQHEQSPEDDNRFVLSVHALVLGLVWRF
jgi:hypothetical protein